LIGFAGLISMNNFELGMHLNSRIFLNTLVCLLGLSAFIVDASEFGTSDIYTASIVAARNNIPVLLFRDVQCKLCPKVEDFLVGLGAQYQTVMSPSSYPNLVHIFCIPQQSIPDCDVPLIIP
jgi:hypothetical protein